MKKNEKKMKEQGSRVKIQKWQSRAKEEVSKKHIAEGVKKLKCSIRVVLKAFENLQTLLLGQIFEDTMVRNN